ncbi:MAG: hypothetical protein WC091_17855 [Sulfuricellaceae bacterium]
MQRFYRNSAPRFLDMPRNVTTYLIFNPFILRQAQDERIKNKVGCRRATSAYTPEQGQIFPFVVSRIFARRPKGVGKKQGSCPLFLANAFRPTGEYSTQGERIFPNLMAVEETPHAFPLRPPRPLR